MENKQYVPWNKQQYEQKQRELLERKAEEINSSIIPDKPGYVRITGPRKQSRAEIINGMLHLTEI